MARVLFYSLLALCVFSRASFAVDCRTDRDAKIQSCIQEARKGGKWDDSGACAKEFEPEYKNCVAHACDGLGPSCRTFTGAPADFGRKPNPESVYRSCDEQRAAGYVPGANEYDLCGLGKPPAKSSGRVFKCQEKPGGGEACTATSESTSTLQAGGAECERRGMDDFCF